MPLPVARWGFQRLVRGDLYGISIAFTIRSVDHSLSTRLILQNCARKKPSFEEKTRFRDT